MSCKHWFIGRTEVSGFADNAIPVDYDRCALCHTYRSLKADPSIYTEDYWSEKYGHGSLYQQAYNCDLHIENGCSKSKFILDRIASERYAALEIGCAPGRMLYWLKWAARFKYIAGIDPADQLVIGRISCDAADDVFNGVFPGEFPIYKPDFAFDYILASDVFEHSTQPIEFLAACARLLKPGGQLFLMLPLADGLPPDSRMFNAIEHAYLHSKANMIAMMQDAGFERLQTDSWASGHDTITGFKS